MVVLINTEWTLISDEDESVRFKWIKLVTPRGKKALENCKASG